jgi:hypothetical protein
MAMNQRGTGRRPYHKDRPGYEDHFFRLYIDDRDPNDSADYGLELDLIDRHRVCRRNLRKTVRETGKQRADTEERGIREKEKERQRAAREEEI